MFYKVEVIEGECEKWNHLEEVGWVGLKKVPYSGHSYNLIDFD
jgi:hypothetical protein